MSIVRTIVSGQLLFAECAVNAGKVKVPVSFRQDYPRRNCIHVTNHICFHQRCVLLLTLDQFHEFATALRAFDPTGQDRDAELGRMFFIGGAEEVQIVGDKLPIPKRLLKYLGAYKSEPLNATLCWLPPKSPASATRQRAKPKRHLVPA